VRCIDLTPYRLSGVKRPFMQCKATTKAGHRCTAKATDSGKCFLHTDPSAAAELGRRGGQRNRHVQELSEVPEWRLRTNGDVVSLLGETINMVRRRQVDPRVANAVGYLSGILLKAMEQGELEERVAKLEADMATTTSANAGVHT